jgi:hypothetical protein
MTLRTIAIAVVLLGFSAGTVLAAEDIVAAHPKNVKVEFENAQVRVMRVTLAPHEKLDLHVVRDLVNVPLTDYTVLHTGPDGKPKEFPRKMGKPEWVPGGERDVEAGDKPVESILVEIKTPAPAK